MNAFIRNYGKCGVNTQLSIKNNRYFSTPWKSHLGLVYGFDVDRSSCYVDRAKLLPTNYTPKFGVVESIEYSSSPARCIVPYRYGAVRHFRFGQQLCDQPSSKVEVTVQTMKDKQKEKVEEILKEVSSSSIPFNVESVTEAAATATPVGGKKKKTETTVAVPLKKPLTTRIWEEVVHYYHGFRLLFIDINICRKLLWRVLNGNTLTRRESRLLVRTTSDLFRLIPFSVFIIVPFMEVLLPVFITLFPGMLPSTFQTAKERENKMKQSVQIRLEMVKFLQKTLDEMAVQHKEHKSEDAKQFDIFFQKIKNPNEYVSNEEIIKYAKRFEDEITLDSLSREQLVALCRILELNTMGTTNLLRFLLRMKLRSLAADDRVIAREGVNSLDLCELQMACKARGMRAYGLTEERMRTQLQEWIDLSLNEKVPPTLLLLSRAMFISDDSITTDKLKETIRVLPDSIAAQTKAAIGEREGKIDNKTKIQIIKEEERKIKEELEEEREEAKAKAKAEKELLVDKAPIVDSSVTPPLVDTAATITTASLAADKATIEPILSTVTAAATAKEVAAEKAAMEEEKSISSKDVELLSEALKTLSTDKKMVVEKETIKDLKEELAEYKEDIEELHEVRQVVKEPVHESRAAKMLFKKVNSMLNKLDKVLVDLEQRQAKAQGKPVEQPVAESESAPPAEEIVHIDELVHLIKQLKQTSDESRLKQIENVLSKLDADKDGVITVDEVLKVIEAIGRENVKLTEKQLEELLTMLGKEHSIETEQRIEKALAKSMKEEEDIKKKKENISKKSSEELMDCGKLLTDKATDMSYDSKKHRFDRETMENTGAEDAFAEAAEKQKEKILPKSDLATNIPPTIPTTSAPPPPPQSLSQANAKDKML